jgi:hypothetical protein
MCRFVTAVLGTSLKLFRTLRTFTEINEVRHKFAKCLGKAEQEGMEGNRVGT